MAEKLIFGIGVNDINHKTHNRINGKDVMCEIFSRWRGMISRCYTESRLKNHPSYIDVTVCNEWLVFSNFKIWMESKNWKGMHLDKDILVPNNKVYHPDLCCFVPRGLNNFILEGNKSKTGRMAGVHLEKQTGRFKAQCHNPFTMKNENLGRYDYEDEAHAAWKMRKLQLAIEWSKIISDKAVINAVVARYE